MSVKDKTHFDADLPMSDLSLLVATLATATQNQSMVDLATAQTTTQVVAPVIDRSELVATAWGYAQPETSPAAPEFSLTSRPASTAVYLPDASASVVNVPRSGSQLYAQRLAALRSGVLATRLPSDSFQAIWSQARQKPTYTQWRQLMVQEARAVVAGQGSNRLAVILGDSLSQWYPNDLLLGNQLWLNQALSGDNTRGILRRLDDMGQTRPSVIYLMAGINDLKQGVSRQEIIRNFSQIVTRLQQRHPQAQIVIQSVLPTQSVPIGNDRIAALNQQLASLAAQKGAVYLDVHRWMVDETGQMTPRLTTDGLHLSQSGYEVWQQVLRQADVHLASGRLRNSV